MAKSREELLRVVDQMISQHARLRDRYQTANRVTLSLVAVLSVLSLTFALSPSTLADWLSLNLSGAESIVVLSSATAFVFSLFGLVFRWTERATKSGQGAARCSDLKLALREASDDARAGSLYREAMQHIAPIPDSAFVGLKAHHLRKVAASRLLDEHPGLPGWLARLVVVWRSLRRSEWQHGSTGE